MLVFSVVSNPAQSFDRIAKGQAKDILKAVKGAIKEDYFDSTFRGMDIDARFQSAEEKIDSASSIGQAFGIIAQAVIELNDSHTRFYPPSRAATVEYGWRMQMIGDKCFVTAIKPKSDAEAKGLKVGDQIIQIGGFKPTRKEMWKINYYYNAISPRTNLNLKVISPGESAPRDMIVESKVTTTKARLSLEDLIREIDLDTSGGVTHRFAKVGGTTVWKMPSFVIDPIQVDQIMQARLKGSSNLIIDLRNNGGGYVVALERLAGYFVEKDTEIATLKGRKPMKPLMAKTVGKDVYKGKVIVLVDANSGSASEIFSRFLQLERRAVVIGDRSAGAVMQSRSLPMRLGADSIIPYGMSITNADVIMTDGTSLEHIGVTPHIELVPDGSDLFAGRDPILSAAFKLLDQSVPPQESGSMFPRTWEVVIE
jgi:carboxyl-terminal processing protease